MSLTILAASCGGGTAISVFALCGVLCAGHAPCGRGLPASAPVPSSHCQFLCPVIPRLSPKRLAAAYSCGRGTGAHRIFMNCRRSVHSRCARTLSGVLGPPLCAPCRPYARSRRDFPPAGTFSRVMSCRLPRAMEAGALQKTFMNFQRFAHSRCARMRLSVETSVDALGPQCVKPVQHSCHTRGDRWQTPSLVLESGRAASSTPGSRVWQSAGALDHAPALFLAKPCWLCPAAGPERLRPPSHHPTVNSSALSSCASRLPPSCSRMTRSTLESRRCAVFFAISGRESYQLHASLNPVGVVRTGRGRNSTERFRPLGCLQLRLAPSAR